MASMPRDTQFHNVLPVTTARMRRVRQKDSGAEILLRRELHARGLRYRLHARTLPGSPDIVFTRARVAVFVHGCFWHRHPGCAKATSPKNNASVWASKFASNVRRDAAAIDALTSLGWRVVVVWECEVLGDRGSVADLVSSVVRQELRRLEDPRTGP